MWHVVWDWFFNHFMPQKSAGGVLLPKSAVKFERYLLGEVSKTPSFFLSSRMGNGTKLLSFFMFLYSCYCWVCISFQILSTGADAGELGQGKKVRINFWLACWFSYWMLQYVSNESELFSEKKKCLLVPSLKKRIFLVLQVLFSDISAYEVSHLSLKITCSFQQLYFRICIVVHHFPFETGSYHSLFSFNST